MVLLTNNLQVEMDLHLTFFQVVSGFTIFRKGPKSAAVAL